LLFQNAPQNELLGTHKGFFAPHVVYDFSTKLDQPQTEKCMKKIIGLAVLAAMISTSAMAAENTVGVRVGYQSPYGHGAFPAPEIDPASALTAMTMLGSGLVMLRGRRSKK
jgi:hypothetical protein